MSPSTACSTESCFKEDLAHDASVAPSSHQHFFGVSVASKWQMGDHLL